MTEAPLLYAANTALGRFGIANLVDSPDPFVSSMPVAGLVNPVTGTPTAGPLAVLVDHASGLVNHYRRADDEWTVSSELSLELTPTALTVIAAKARRCRRRHGAARRHKGHIGFRRVRAHD